MSHATPTIELVHTASQRLVRTVDSLDDDTWAKPSLLPGWTVAHVVAHLALNAEGLRGALVGVAEGEPVTMYASQDARNADIDALAKAEPAQIRDRMMASVTTFAAAVAGLPPERAGTLVERTPGSGTRFPAGAVASMRLREVEIHHADIGAVVAEGYSPADWPDEFTRLLLDHEAKRYAGPGFRAVAADLDETWEFGTPGPTVSGSGHEIAWWGTGRAPYPGTSGPVSDNGVLPGIEEM